MLPTTSHKNGTTTYPLAEHIADKTPLAFVVDPVAKELYGVTEAVVDEKKTVATFNKLYSEETGYWPFDEEREVAIDIFEARHRNMRRRDGIAD